MLQPSSWTSVHPVSVQQPLLSPVDAANSPPAQLTVKNAAITSRFEAPLYLAHRNTNTPRLELSDNTLQPAVHTLRSTTAMLGEWLVLSPSAHTAKLHCSQLCSRAGHTAGLQWHTAPTCTLCALLPLNCSAAPRTRAAAPALRRRSRAAALQPLCGKYGADAQVVPVIAQEVPVIAQEVPVIAQVVPVIAQEVPVAQLLQAPHCAVTPGRAAAPPRRCSYGEAAGPVTPNIVHKDQWHLSCVASVRM